MIFAGLNVCHSSSSEITDDGSKTYLYPTISEANKISTQQHKLVIQNGKYNDMFISFDSNASSIVWDENTVLHAEYNGDLDGGNIEFSTTGLTSIRIKRRIAGQYGWTILTEYLVDATSSSSLNIIYHDKYARSRTKYEYAIVPVYTNIEGEPEICDITSEFDGVFIVDKYESYNTPLSVEISNTKIQGGVTVKPINTQHPYYIKPGNSNYSKGTCKGIFINKYLTEHTEDSWDWDIDNGWLYRQNLTEFLSNGKPKILKCFDGRIYLIGVTSDITETVNSHYDLVSTSFNYEEIGDCNSTQDLYDCGLIDINMR